MRSPLEFGMRPVVALIVSVILAGPPIGTARAQEGHPLSGTWAGEWGAANGTRTHVTLVMAWDGQAVTGLINPGPDAIPLTRVTVDWSTWTLRIEAERAGTTGTPQRIVADGRLEDIGSTHRRIVGIWQQDGVTGSLRLTRE
jgi:hypothetical protein